MSLSNPPHQVSVLDRRDTIEMVETATRTSKVALEADLHLVHLPSLLQLVESELHTGRIEFAPGGSIDIVSGQVVGARTHDGLEHEFALHELFFVDTGRVSVVLDESVRGTPLGPTFGIIMDGAKLIDEWTQLADERWLLAESTPVPPEREPEVTLLRPLLVAMSRGATLGRAYAQVSQRARTPARAQLVPALLRLIENGLVSATAPIEHEPLHRDESTHTRPRHIAPHRDDETLDVDELLMRARLLLKSLDLDRAEDLLQQALDARPNDRVIAQNLRIVTQRRRALHTRDHASDSMRAGLTDNP